MKNSGITFFMIFSGLLIITIPVSGQDINPAITRITDNLQNYFEKYSYQKAYLHLDKSYYRADETIWFSACLVNGKTHLPDSSTDNLYVDLMNPSGYTVQSKMLRLRNGFAYGDFSFSDTIPEGVYRIYAYTNTMKNSGPAFFYSKAVYIENPGYGYYASREDVQKTKKAKRKNERLEDKTEVDFLPEGGYMLEGVSGRVAFKAINELGQGVVIDGKITGRKGKEVAAFNSTGKGLGYVEFSPVPGEKYQAVIKSPQGKTKIFSLPEPLSQGVVLRTENQPGNKINVKVMSNIDFPSGIPAPVYYLVGHVRGNVVFTRELNLDNSALQLSAYDFPEGVLHLTLFDTQLKPVSERLVFIYHNRRQEVQIVPSVSMAGKREMVHSSISLKGHKGETLSAVFSAAVSPVEESVSDAGILSTFLLTSDIRGKVEDPDWYFKDYNPEKEKELDILMMVHGWRRFNWTNVMNPKLPAPSYRKEDKIEIHGRITKEFFNLPLADIKVTLTVLNGFNELYTTRSALNGDFKFSGLDYQDTVFLKIEAARASGRKNLLIYVFTRDELRDPKAVYYTNQVLKKPGEAGRMYVEEEPEKDPFEEQNNDVFRLHQVPNDVIIVDDNMKHYQNIAQILQGRVPGVLVTGNSVTIRGINSIYGNTEPLYLVDGMIVDQGYALSLSPSDVERIEILKGPETAIYGSRGANGVIAIYTQRGKFMIKGVLEMDVLGYYTPKEFYNPRYELLKEDPVEDDRRTLYWAPEIVTGSEGLVEISFPTSDITGLYRIHIQGLTTDGKPIGGSAFFEVK